MSAPWMITSHARTRILWRASGAVGVIPDRSAESNAWQLNQAWLAWAASVHDDLVSVWISQHGIGNRLRVEPRHRAPRIMTREPVVVEPQDAARAIARREDRVEFRCRRRRRVIVHFTKATLLEMALDRVELGLNGSVLVSCISH